VPADFVRRCQALVPPGTEAGFLDRTTSWMLRADDLS
jgi:hypothetical protein